MRRRTFLKTTIAGTGSYLMGCAHPSGSSTKPLDAKGQELVVLVEPKATARVRYAVQRLCATLEDTGYRPSVVEDTEGAGESAQIIVGDGREGGYVEKLID